jgi:acetyl-CoA carboxylase carboxyl transferase subunit beta
MSLFKKTPQYTVVKAKKNNIPDGIWTKCGQCEHPIFNKSLKENDMVCPDCGFHFALPLPDRIGLLIDEGTFVEHDRLMCSENPLEFTAARGYPEKLKGDQKATGLVDAAIWGEGKIQGRDVVFAGTDSRFIMGSMGSVVGEKVARAAEFALKTKKALVVVSGSGGGARMYEGMFSLMQMAKTCGALALLKEANVPYISVHTHPTMAGILASFAGVGDITIAEPGALIGFAGPRVIEQTTKQKLPEGFQRSEFNQKHGWIDIIAERKDLKNTIARVIAYTTSDVAGSCKEK